MADPRIVKRENRKDNRSELMKAVIDCSMNRSEPPNFCPYGCEAHELNDNGYCHHLVGFTNGGKFYEPRVINDTGREQVDGKNKVPLKKGMTLEEITVSARVYSKKGNPALRTIRDRDGNERADSIAEEERKYAELLDRLRRPVLSGVLDGSEYDIPDVFDTDNGIDTTE